MAALNKVMIIGNLGKDPDNKYLQSGDAVCNFSVATTEKWKDKASGEMKEATEWHSIAAFGRNAEVAGEYLRKGSSVYVEGSLRTRKWQDKDGKDRYTTEIRADKLLLLGGKPSAGGSEAAPREAPKPAQRPSRGGDDFEDSIPF